MQKPAFSIETSRFWQNTALFFLFTGAALRVIVWWQNRSLFIDEANLIRNFIEKPWSVFFGQLNYGQYSPPIFSLLEKTVLEIFGNTERVARFWPLIAGLASLPIAWRLGRRWLSPVGLAAFSLFMAFEGTFIHFSSQVKQYSFDGLVTLTLLELSQTLDFQRHKWLWGLLGAAVIWLSMPSVFTLAAIGCWFGWRLFRQGNPTPDPSPDGEGSKIPLSLFAPPYRGRGRGWGFLALVATVWAISFATYFFLILNENVHNDALRVSHIFLPFPPKNGTDFVAWWNAISGLSNWTVGFTAVAYLVFFGGLAAGGWSFFKRKSANWMLLVLPIFFGLVAVAAGFYSMMERLWLFALPPLLLWLAIGWDVFLKEKAASNSLIVRQLPRMLAVSLLLLCAAAQLKYDWFWRPLQNEEFRAALEFMETRHRPDDRFFVHHDAAPVVHFYLHLADRKFDFTQNSLLSEWRDEADFWKKDLQKLIENTPPGSCCRLLWNGKLAENDLAFLKKTGDWQPEFSFPGGELWVINR